MAKLSAHGTEIGTVYGLKSAKRYMSDGVVLKNIGFGWKLHARVKAGIDPQDAFVRHQSAQERHHAERPAYVAYRKALHGLAGLGKRWKLNAAVSMMPEDPDGVWSEACDGYADNISADVSDIVDLCRLYRAARAEGDSK